jgi:uncharacterized YigZ family protein
MSDTYFLPAEEIRHELTVSNSRFIATLVPVSSVDEAKTFVARIRKEFVDASHNVPAYIIGGGNSITEYCSDDGEPSGTAGRPALAVLRGSGLGNVAVVVTRYFGGTLLGKGGLVKAYIEATQLVVQTVPCAKRVPVHIVMLALPYPLLERVRLLVSKYHGEITDEDFAADVTMTLRFPVDEFSTFQNALQELSAGSLQGEIIETKEMLVKIQK